MRFLIELLLLTILYVMLGAYFDKNNIITKPEYWSLYGVIFGILFSIITFTN